MKEILIPAIITITALALNIYLGMRRSPIFYVILFILLAIFNSLFFQEAQAFIPNAQIEIKSLGNLKSLTPTEISYYVNKIEFHQDNAKRTFQDAQKRSWYIPSYNDRKIARDCFLTAAASFTSNDPKSKIITMLVASLSSYGLACFDQWEYINEKLYWSHYHYEMAEFYSRVLVKG